MGEISAASREQSAGVLQVGQAITQMDQVTQQNAALVEESAPAADSLRHQAAQLVQVMDFFQLDESSRAARPATPPPAAAPRPVVSAARAASTSSLKAEHSAKPPQSATPTAAKPAALTPPPPRSAKAAANDADGDAWESF